ncbi:MAG: hypothetical protein FJ112_04610 [Deltaproteobacteria bacterium]|nr:hypothetical protein [Deltaproteobacteria bacterium]
MFVKKFEAPNLEQALKLVKSEMGPEALVLSTQEKRSGKLFSRRTVEVTAAIEKKKDAKLQTYTRQDKQQRSELDDSSEDALREMVAYKKALTKEVQLKKNKPERYIDIDTPSEGEVQNIRKTTLPSEASKNNSLKYEASFKVMGICPERSIELGRKVNSEYGKSELSDPELFKKAKIKVLSVGIRTMASVEFFKRRAWVPVGVAGAGKTTLLVKLAILAKEQEKSVSLISMDNRKISGRGELASYARLVKAPFFTEINQAPIEKMKLIDSPALGLNGENQSTLEKLCVEKSSFLVLDASSRLSELMRQVDRAMEFHPEGVVFTKVDNIEDRGVIYDVLKSTQLPLIGLSISSSFKTRFRFFNPSELAQFLIKE